MTRAGTSSSAGTTDPARRSGPVLQWGVPWLLAVLCGCGPENLFAPWEGGAGPAWVQEGGAPDGLHAALEGPEPPLSLVWRQAVGGAPLGGPLIAGPLVLQLTRRTDALAFDLATGTRVGRRRLDRPLCAAAALAGGRGQLLLMAMTGRGAGLHAVHRASGETAWRRPGEVCAPPAVAGGRVYAAVESGRLEALSPDRGGLLWQIDLPGRLLSAASLGGGAVYVGDSTGELVAASAAGGGVLWRRSLGAAISTRPAIDAGAGRLWVATADGSVHALGAEDGSTQWTARVNGLPAEGLSRGAGVIALGSSDQALYAFDPESGRQRWRFETGGVVRAPAVSTAKTLYLGSGGSVLHAVGGDGGVGLWRYALDGPVLTSVAVSGRLLAVTSETGTLYLFRGR